MSAAQFTRLPRMVRDIAERLGLPAALELVEKLGGVTVPIPVRQSLRGESRYRFLMDRLGTELAGALCREYGGTDLYVPNCRQTLIDERNAALNRNRDELAKKGVSERELVAILALKYKVSDRNVWRILKRTYAPECIEIRAVQGKLW